MVSVGMVVSGCCAAGQTPKNDGLPYGSSARLYCKPVERFLDRGQFLLLGLADPLRSRQVVARGIFIAVEQADGIDVVAVGDLLGLDQVMRIVRRPIGEES